MCLRDYPTGTRVRIGDRTFCKTETGTFWKEEHSLLGNQVSRPAVSLETIERQVAATHVVLRDK